MRRALVLSLSMIIILVMCVSSAAHSGRTDENGGHRNSSTGEYHYHHGYPAHQHENGICPYDYDDKTGVNSGSSSHSESDDAVAEPVENKSDKIIKVSISGVNQSFGIAAGDKVQLTAQTSSEIIGYISQDVDGVLEVTVTPAAQA